MSRTDEIFCEQVAQVTHSKKLPVQSKEKIRLLVKSMKVGTMKRAVPPKK